MCSALVCALLLTGCGSNETKECKSTVYAMDTVMELTAYTNNDDVLNDAKEKIEEIDKRFRRGSEDSEIYAVNNNSETKLTDETAYVVETALNIGKKTIQVSNFHNAAETDVNLTGREQVLIQKSRCLFFDGKTAHYLLKQF